MVWSEPEGFVFHHLVRTIVRSELYWTVSLATLRLVNKSWLHGISEAIEVLAPRPTACTSDLIFLHKRFCNLKVLRIQSPTVDGVTMNELFWCLGDGICHLKKLQAINCFSLSPRTVAATLYRLKALQSLELSVPGDACMAALNVLAECSTLQCLSFFATAGIGSGGIAELSDTLPLVARLTNLHSLACSARSATAAQLIALSALAQLSSLALADVAESSTSAIAELAGVSLSHTLHQLDFALDYNHSLFPLVVYNEGGGAVLADISAVMPLSCLNRLSALSAPWELFTGQPRQLSCLRGITSLAVDFHNAVDTMGDEILSRDVCCALLLRRLRGLQRLHLANGGSEVSSASLRDVSELAPSLTCLEMDRMFEADNGVMHAVCGLSRLQRLRLVATSFDARGAEELGRLGELTRLELINSAGVMGPMQLADAIAQVTSLRRLLLKGHPYMGRPTLDHILSSLSYLKLFQSTWKPDGGDEEDAMLCAKWRHVLQHSIPVITDDITRGWTEFDAVKALHEVGVTDASDLTNA